jgi:hypothetical protein
MDVRVLVHDDAEGIPDQDALTGVEAAVQPALDIIVPLRDHAHAHPYGAGLLREVEGAVIEGTAGSAGGESLLGRGDRVFVAAVAGNAWGVAAREFAVLVPSLAVRPDQRIVERRSGQAGLLSSRDMRCQPGRVAAAVVDGGGVPLDNAANGG